MFSSVPLYFLNSETIDTCADGTTPLLQVTVLAAACFYTTVKPSFCQPRFRPYRAAIYTGLGLSALIFIIHGLVIHGWKIQNRRMSPQLDGTDGRFQPHRRCCLRISSWSLQLILGRTLTSFRFRKGGIHIDMTSMAAAIRYSISW